MNACLSPSGKLFDYRADLVDHLLRVTRAPRLIFQIVLHLMVTAAMLKVLEDFSEYSTIQGLVYIFQRRQTLVGRIFWIFVVLVMLSLGISTSIDSYNAWQRSPVLTTLTSAALPVRYIEFPAFTICAPGMNNDILRAVVIREFKIYLEKVGVKINMSAYDAAYLFYKKVLSTFEWNSKCH